MNESELKRAIEELNELAGTPGNEERCLELARALNAHYMGKDKPKEDKNQLKLQFKDE